MMPDKRLHPRFQKNYTITLTLRNDPQRTFDPPLIVDISVGGLKFISSDPLALGAKIFFNIHFPFLYPQATVVEGEVVGVTPAPGARTFKVRARFINVTPSGQPPYSRWYNSI